jgi:hypothetical protein
MDRKTTVGRTKCIALSVLSTEKGVATAEVDRQHHRVGRLELITKKKGFATREDIVNLIMPTLSPIIPAEKGKGKYRILRQN